MRYIHFMDEQFLKKLSPKELSNLLIKTVDELFSMCDMSQNSAFGNQKKKEIGMIQKAIDAVTTNAPMA